MKITEKIINSKKPLFSIEILPPKKGENIIVYFTPLTTC